jgi:hypothetical protein
MYNDFEKSTVRNGLGSGSAIPINTLYTVPTLESPSAKSALLNTGANSDTLYSAGLAPLSQ